MRRWLNIESDTIVQLHDATSENVTKISTMEEMTGICTFLVYCYTAMKASFHQTCPKITNPQFLISEFRPISVTTVLTRIMGRLVVTHSLYSCLLNPPPTLSFEDQYAFSPTGSPTTALIKSNQIKSVDLPRRLISNHQSSGAPNIMISNKDKNEHTK